MLADPSQANAQCGRDDTCRVRSCPRQTPPEFQRYRWHVWAMPILEFDTETQALLIEALFAARLKLGEMVTNSTRRLTADTSSPFTPR